MSSASRPLVHVVAGVVFDTAGRLLIAQRPEGKHLAGGWEFPGGKLEPGEERRDGLARELHEELGIRIGTPRPLIRVRHAYPTRDILLDVWVVRSFEGQPRGLDGQALRWCSREELATVELLPADGPIVRALWLPERLRERATLHYEVRELGSRENSSVRTEEAVEGRLRGIFCADAEAGYEASRSGADFLVMQGALDARKLAALCDSIPIPVFARGFELEAAWGFGATGLNEFGASSR